MGDPKAMTLERARELVRKAVAGELPPGATLPADEEDFVQNDAVDSMGWVGILSAIEEATGLRNFGNPWPEGKPQSVRAVADLLCAASTAVPHEGHEERPAPQPVRATVFLKGWGCSLGSTVVPADEIEKMWNLPARTLCERAGIESVRKASESEDEVSLAQRAAEAALARAQVDAADVDFVVATSTTFLRLPSLAATLHSRLLLREECGALDVGGSCAGLIYALATASGLLQSGAPRAALIVASEAHSRRLAPPRLPGELCGLFGDGACALVVTTAESAPEAGALRLGAFIWGCSGTFSSSLAARAGEGQGVEVEFNGEQLAHAAITQLSRVIDGLEIRSGRSRSEVSCFALHQPNPRLVEILAERAQIPLRKIPLVSASCGNLGAATCGVSLCQALEGAVPPHSLVFLAAVAPGLIWGGAYLS